MKRILLIQETYLPIKGGAEFHVYYLAKYLLKAGYVVEIVTGSQKSEDIDSNGEICTVNRYRLNNGIKKLLQFPFWFNVMLRHAMDKDVLHAHYTSYLAFITAIVAKILKKRYVVTLHGLGTLDSSVKKSLFKRFFRYASIRLADTVIATSDEMKRVASRYTKSDKIVIIENGADTNFFVSSSEKFLERNVMKFATVRRLVPKNGVHFFAQTLAFYLKDIIDFNWKVIGYREMVSELKKTMHNADIADKVNYMGALDHEGVKRELDKVDFAVFLSTAESTSLAALEAMSMGCIVITSNAGAFPEFVQDGKNGFMIDLFDEGMSNYLAPKKLEPWQYEKIKEKIVYINSLSRGELLTISNCAREFVVNQYDWAKITNKIVAQAYL